jgi:hypothetical protein
MDLFVHPSLICVIRSISSTRTTFHPEQRSDLTGGIRLFPACDPPKSQFRPRQFPGPIQSSGAIFFPAANPGMARETILAARRQGGKGRREKGSARRQSQLCARPLGTTTENLPRFRPAHGAQAHRRGCSSSKTPFSSSSLGQHGEPRRNRHRAEAGS